MTSTQNPATAPPMIAPRFVEGFVVEPESESVVEVPALEAILDVVLVVKL
jgi:hypothetical protein